MELLTTLSDVQFPARSVAYTATAGNTATWQAGPQGVMVWSSTDAYVAVGEGAVATTASIPLPANVPVPLKVPAGSGNEWRVSAIQITTGGTVYTKPMNI
jgi:hypothetical protein